MDMPSLEDYFDRFIANDVLSTEKQEEVTEEEQEKLFFKLLPDDLLMSTFTWDDTAESRTFDKPSPDSSSTLDYSSQNSSAGAEFAQVSELKACALNPITTAILKELPKPTPVIRNVISSVNLGCHLNLDIIARNMWNIQYDPKTFRGLIVRNREPKATVTMFATGKMICSGTNSMVKSRLVVRKFARKLQKFGFPVRFLNFKINNLMAVCRTFPVNLEKLYKICRPNCSYEPELFNGFLSQMTPGIRVTIFTSGSIILCGDMSYAEVRAGNADMKARPSNFTAAHFRPLWSLWAAKDLVYVGRDLQRIQPLNLDTAIKNMFLFTVCGNAGAKSPVEVYEAFEAIFSYMRRCRKP